MPRFECKRDDIPDKWHTIDLIPGEGDDWLLLTSNGVTDPTRNELPMNDPHPEFKGTFEEASAAMEKKIAELVDLGYVKVKNEEP